MRRLTERPAGRRGGRDTGAGSVEYVGGIGIAALVIAMVIAGLAGIDVRGHASYAICKVLTLGQGDCAQPVTADRDRTPPGPCLVTSEGAKAGIKGAAGVVVNGDEVWLIEQLSDDTYRITRGYGIKGGAEVGYGLGAGVTVDGVEYGFDAKVGAEFLAGLEAAETWVVGSKEEAQDLISRGRYEDGVGAVAPEGSPFRWAIDKLTGHESPPEPDEVYVEVGVEGTIDADLAWTILPGAAAGAEGKIEGAVGYTTRKDGTTTVYLDAEMSGEAWAGIWTKNDDGDNKYAKAGIEGTLGGKVELNYDAEGNATSVKVTSTQQGDAYADDDPQNPTWTDTVLELPLKTAADKELAARMLAQFGVPYVPGVSTEPLPRNPFTLMDDAEDFGQAVADRGYLNDETYTIDDRKDGAHFDVEYVLKVGLEVEREAQTRTTIQQRYFDGTEMVVRPGCGPA